MQELRADDLGAIDKVLDQLDNLHSSPLVGRKIVELTRDLNYDLGELTRCVESDPALAAKILRIVNSSHYGLAHRTTNLRSALVWFGLRSLRLIALTFHLVDGLTTGLNRQLSYHFWRRAISMATVGARLSEKHADLERDDGYAAGLLCDLGVLALAQVVGDKYLALYEAASDNKELLELEHNEFGFCHPAVGARLLERWEFPEEIVAATAHHHEESPDVPPLTLCAQTSDVMADALWAPESPQLSVAQKLLETHYSTNSEGLVEMAELCKEDIRQNAELFGVRIHEQIDCDALRQAAQKQLVEASLESAVDLEASLQATWGG